VTLLNSLNNPREVHLSIEILAVGLASQRTRLPVVILARLLTLDRCLEVRPASIIRVHGISFFHSGGLVCFLVPVFDFEPDLLVFRARGRLLAQTVIALSRLVERAVKELLGLSLGCGGSAEGRRIVSHRMG